MAKSGGTPPIIYVVIFLAIVGGGYWFFLRKPPTGPAGNITSNLQPTPNPPPPPDAEFFPSPASVPPDTEIKIDGSTSMVTITQNLKQGFEGQFPARVQTVANGTDSGIRAVLNGEADIAGVSRSLTPEEENQGLKALPIASDQIAIVVGVNNPYKGGLTDSQVAQIFSGEIRNWSAVGGPDATIEVLNRPPVSGTHQTFQEMVLQGRNFGTTPNITTLPRDETTGMLRQLGQYGIGYATFTQVISQQTVRTVPVEGVEPGSLSYPYQRQLYYVYKQPASPGVRAILGYATSPSGQEALFPDN